jgi:hypothetical protein
MVVRWIRNALVLAAAALGLRYVRTIADRRPAPRRERDRIPDGPLIVNGGTPSTRRMTTTSLEPHGAL